jgi:hypothetical protein
VTSHASRSPLTGGPSAGDIGLALGTISVVARAHAARASWRRHRDARRPPSVAPSVRSSPADDLCRGRGSSVEMHGGAPPSARPAGCSYGDAVVLAGHRGEGYCRVQYAVWPPRSSASRTRRSRSSCVSPGTTSSTAGSGSSVLMRECYPRRCHRHAAIRAGLVGSRWLPEAAVGYCWCVPSGDGAGRRRARSTRRCPIRSPHFRRTTYGAVAAGRRASSKRCRRRARLRHHP